jgi:hypothetical protein
MVGNCRGANFQTLEVVVRGFIRGAEDIVRRRRRGVLQVEREQRPDFGRSMCSHQQTQRELGRLV